MADTQRTVAEILALLANNTSGAISPQDIRDALVTWQPGFGQLYVAAADSAAVTIPDTTNYVELNAAPAWTLTATARLCDQSGGNGRLTYTGTPDVEVLITASVSFSSASNNQNTYWRLGVSGTTDEASETHRKTGSAGDVGALSLHAIETLSTNDYVSVWVRNTTSASNVTIEVADIQIFTMAK